MTYKDTSLESIKGMRRQFRAMYLEGDLTKEQFEDRLQEVDEFRRLYLVERSRALGRNRLRLIK